MSKRGSSIPSDCEPEVKIAPIFKSRGQRNGDWKVEPGQLMVYTSENIGHRTKVAGFDLDGTLIKSKSGHAFGKDADDWQLWSGKVVSTLRKCHEDGFKVCIFTNQKGIQLNKVRPEDFKRKIGNICSAIGLPLQVFISIGPPKYRKPYIGMWKRMEESENGGVSVNASDSIYVGDAAGRTKTETRPKADHSCADRLFALNLSVKFYTPEQFFSKIAEEEPFQLPKFNPAQFLKEVQPKEEFNAPDKPEMVVLVGSPASGKTTFARRFKGYSIVSQDVLRTREKCVAAAKSSLREGNSVVIDNTNRNVETRQFYCDLARSLSAPCRCFIVDCTLEQAIHNNIFRQIVGTDRAHQNVDEKVIRAFFLQYQEPKLEEGFADIQRVKLAPEFDDEQHRRIYAMYLTEK